MGNEYAGGIHVVAVTRDDKTEYWAVATRESEAVSTVQALLAPGWKASLTNRRLSTDQVAALKLRPGGVRQLP